MEWIKNNSPRLDGTLIVYHPNLLAKTKIAKLPKLDKIEEFKLPKLIWSFLESFYPGNADRCFRMFNKIVETEPVEFVFALLARQMRDLYWVKAEEEEKKVGENFQAWRVGKLRSQANKFGECQIKEIINNLAEIDIKVKTSKADLASSLDFLIATRLE